MLFFIANIFCCDKMLDDVIDVLGRRGEHSSLLQDINTFITRPNII